VDKGRMTWKANLERDHPERVEILKGQRLAAATVLSHQAAACERAGDFLGARRAYTSAVESVTQYDTLTGGSVAEMVSRFKTAYEEFALGRDPLFKQYLAALLPIIRANPGILQTDLYSRTSLEKADVSYCLYFAGAGGLVKRTKKGRTYELSV
jgi:hypothetical protein